MERGGTRTKRGYEYTHNALETFKRRRGVCDGRSNLLTLVTNNNLLKCNSAVIFGDIPTIHHAWNIFIDKDNNIAYHYDLSFRNFRKREIHDIGERTINRIYNSKVQEILFKQEQPPRIITPPLPPRKNKVYVQPLPPRRTTSIIN